MKFIFHPLLMNSLHMHVKGCKLQVVIDFIYVVDVRFQTVTQYNKNFNFTLNITLNLKFLN